MIEHDIIDIVKKYFNINDLTISRKKEYVYARRVAMYYITLYSNIAYKDIIKEFGLKHKSSITHAKNEARFEKEHYDNCRKDYAQIQRLIEIRQEGMF
jgi:chromosomal replication initiation ATPase DnaA